MPSFWLKMAIVLAFIFVPYFGFGHKNKPT